MYIKRQKPSLYSEIPKINSFWDDCFETPPVKNPTIKNTQIEHVNKQPQRFKKLKNNNTYNLYSSQFFCNFPNIYEDQKNNTRKQKKYKKSRERLQHLYEKGTERQKYIRKCQTQNDLDKIKKELELCTFKPKINKTSRNFEDKLKTFGKNIYMRDKNRQILKQISQMSNVDKKHTESIIFENECTFHPQINEEKNYNKIFNKSKSMRLLTDRDNIAFVSRYAKARDEYLIKRFIKLPYKYESYDNSFIELLQRFYGKKNNNNIRNCSTHQNLIGNKNIGKQYSDRSKKDEKYIFTLRERLKKINLDLNDSN